MTRVGGLRRFLMATKFRGESLEHVDDYEISWLTPTEVRSDGEFEGKGAVTPRIATEIVGPSAKACRWLIEGFREKDARSR